MNPVSPDAGELDWQIPADLFASAERKFRHRMGLGRLSLERFYAPTPDRNAILTARRGVLQQPDGARYVIASEEGDPALAEFSKVLGGAWSGSATSPNARVFELASALEPDWILLNPPDWRVSAAAVCFPTRWSLEGKAGQPLFAIHEVVPGLNPQVGEKIESFFARIVPKEGWSRANWGLTANAELNQHPSRSLPSLGMDTPDRSVWLRVEWQHLCKLPCTGAIAFGIRILNYPLSGVRERPEIAGGLKPQLRSMPAQVSEYKAIPAEFWRRL